MHSSGEPLARAVVLAVAAWGSVVQAQAPAPVGGEASTLTAIRREVLPEVLRVTLELEGEAEVADSVLEGPPRVFVDLRNTETVARLRNVALTFPDDVVRQIRVGHHDNQRTRVVLDLADQNRHSVYLLYEPYRVVIDFERRRDVVAPDGSSETTSVAAARAPDALQPPPPAPPAANGAGGFSLSRQLGLGISRIVVDPGHGGQDPGAQVEGLSEADLVLDVALRFERLMHALPGVEVILTRRENVYLPLDERTAVANAAGADLFLSIHANATRNTKALGIETYFLNFATTSAAEALAARENAGSTRSMGELTELVKAIATNNKMDESRDFARAVQASLFDRLHRTNTSTKNLGVKQAPFSVLLGATMPSLLAEVGFLTHEQEGTLLKSETYRQQIAEALMLGVTAYQRSLKTPAAVATQ